MSTPLESARQRVLTRYGPAVAGVRWTPLGSGGGFSGARVWRGEDANGSPLFALKAWPETVGAEQLTRIHGWMGRAAHLRFVPGVLRTGDFRTVASEGGRVWDVCIWMPGNTATSEHASHTQVSNACAAIAELHRAWLHETTSGPCPGVLNRRRLLEEYHALSGPLFVPPVHEMLDPLVRRASELIQRHSPAATVALQKWATVPVTLKPCVRDLRAAHVLFTNDDVTGIIDYGAMAVDHPAVDLARFLGEIVAEDDTAFASALAAYRSAGGALDVPDEFVRLLDRTGVICSLIGWMRRLFAFHQHVEEPFAAAARMGQLIARGERFASR